MAQIQIWPMEKSVFFSQKPNLVLCHLAPKQNIKISMAQFFATLIAKLESKFQACSPKTMGVYRLLVSEVL